MTEREKILVPRCAKVEKEKLREIVVDHAYDDRGRWSCYLCGRSRSEHVR
jgi:hypothetical protein